MSAEQSLPDLFYYLENGAGDCELRSISFAFPNVRLSFYDPYYKRPFFIILYNVALFYCFSNHVQNVISRIFCFSNWDEANTSLVFTKLASSLGAVLDDFKILPENPILYIEPIAGGEMIAQYRTMKITGEAEEAD